jgi:hypothetical protein
MDILSYNPGHDGAIVHLREGRLIFSVEAEKDSNWRYTPVSTPDLLDAFGRLDQVPDVVCTGGWWPREARPTGATSHAEYRGIAQDRITVDPSGQVPSLPHHGRSPGGYLSTVLQRTASPGRILSHHVGAGSEITRTTWVPKVRDRSRLDPVVSSAVRRPVCRTACGSVLDCKPIGQR